MWEIDTSIIVKLFPTGSTDPVVWFNSYYSQTDANKLMCHAPGNDPLFNKWAEGLGLNIFCVTGFIAACFSTPGKNVQVDVFHQLARD